jgi:FkbM family methyltransferase
VNLDSPELTHALAAQAARAADRRERFAAFGGNGLAIVARGAHGLFLVDPEDSYVGAELLFTGHYDPAGLDMLRALVRPTDRVLVVGAHIGAHIVPLSRLVRHVVAYEANPHTFTLLEANVRMNACDHVTPVCAAASDRVGTLEFLCSRDNSGGSKIVPQKMILPYVYDKPRVATVLCGRIDDDAVPFPNVVLMDIEGSECAAMRGAQKTLAHARAFVVEFIPHHIANVAGEGVDAFIDPIVPHFTWMRVPTSAGVPYRIIEGASAIRAHVRWMFERNEEHEHIIFGKERADLGG